MGKEETALFPQCFLLNQEIVSPYVNIFDIISLFAAELEEPKIGMWGKVLSHIMAARAPTIAFLKFEIRPFSADSVCCYG